MLDIVAPDDHQLTMPVEVERVDDAEPWQPRPAAARQSSADVRRRDGKEKDERRKEQEGNCPSDERETLILENLLE